MGNQIKIIKKEGFGAGVYVVGNRCYRCHYEWIPHNLENIPETCPSCRSPYWNRKKVKFKKGEKEK